MIFFYAAPGTSSVIYGMAETLNSSIITNLQQNIHIVSTNCYDRIKIQAQRLLDIPQM